MLFTILKQKLQSKIDLNANIHDIKTVMVIKNINIFIMQVWEPHSAFLTCEGLKCYFILKRRGFYLGK